MIGEAVDTAVTLGWALAAWIAVFAAVAAVVLLAGTAVGMWAVRGLWRTGRAAWSRRGPRTATVATLAAEQPSRNQSPLEPAERRSAPRLHPAPSWARTDKDAA